jgi:hypothetical protein
MRISPEQIEIAQRRTYLSIPEAAAITSLSGAFWRRAVLKGQVATIRAGRAVRSARRDLINSYQPGGGSPDEQTSRD